MEDLTAGQKMTMQFEGYRDKPYKDTKGKLTVGYGINLDDPAQKKMMEKLGYSGGKLSNDIAVKAFQVAYERAKNDAVSYLGQDVYDGLDQNRKDIINDMSYNLGLSKLSGFEGLRKAVISGDYRTAAREMVNSNWYKQVGNRSKQLVNMMQGKQNDGGFKDAFAGARRMGLKTFTYNGKQYTTETK